MLLIVGTLLTQLLLKFLNASPSFHEVHFWWYWNKAQQYCGTFSTSLSDICLPASHSQRPGLIFSHFILFKAVSQHLLSFLFPTLFLKHRRRTYGQSAYITKIVYCKGLAKSLPSQLNTTHAEDSSQKWERKFLSNITELSKISRVSYHENLPYC